MRFRDRKGKDERDLTQVPSHEVKPFPTLRSSHKAATRLATVAAQSKTALPGHDHFRHVNAAAAADMRARRAGGAVRLALGMTRTTGHARLDRARRAAPQLDPANFAEEVPASLTDRPRLDPVTFPALIALIEAQERADEEARQMAAMAEPTIRRRQPHVIDESDAVGSVGADIVRVGGLPKDLLPPAALHETGSFNLRGELVNPTPAPAALQAIAQRQQPTQELDVKAGVQLDTETRIALDAARGVQAAERIRTTAATANDPRMSRMAEILARAAEDAHFAEEKMREQQRDAAEQARFTQGGGWWGENTSSQPGNALPAPASPLAIEAPHPIAAIQNP